jgi:hypothetical protein
MKKALFLVVVMLPSLLLSAQTKQKKDKEKQAATLPPPRVWIPNIPSYTTTRDMVLANPMLVTDSVGCKVSGFTISLIAPGHDFYGPLYTNGFEMSEPQKDLIKSWNFPDVTMYVQDIHLNCHEQDARADALTYKFTK